MGIKAVAQWEINEITIDIQGGSVILFEEPDKSGFIHGKVGNAQVALSLSEAKNLLSNLALAIEHYEYLDASLEAYYDQEDNQDK